jgi:hypothetical protein
VKKGIVAFAVFLTMTFAVSPAAERATLTGKVTDSSAKPVAHATVMVYRAGVKKGYSAFCPTCYSDCGKTAITDADGSFSIPGLSPDLWFQLLVIREGYRVAVVDKVDAESGGAPTAVLKKRMPVTDLTRVVRGRVVDSQGTPVRDAVVEPEAILLPNGDSMYGGAPKELDPMTVTNDKGEFDLAYAEPIAKMALTVQPRAMAPKFAILAGGSERQTVTVFDGAVVRGRLIENGKPVANAEIGLNPKEAWSGGANLTIHGSFYRETTIGTRDDGTFVFTNVPTPDEWNVYGKMESIASGGATDPIACATNNDHQEINLGDMLIRRAYRIRGQVTLNDGKTIPDGMRLIVTAKRSRDSQLVMLGVDGKFEIRGLAAGDYSIYPGVKGYRSATERGQIDVQVDRDKEVKIALDPIPAK